MYRLTLIGFIQLIPYEFKFIRVIIGLLVTIIYSFCIVMGKPYVLDQVDTLSILTQFGMVLMFLGTVVLLVYDSFHALGGGLAKQFTGFESRHQVGVVLTIGLLGVIAFFLIAVLRDVLLSASQPILMLRRSNAPPNLGFNEGMRWHLFLSHVWSSAQDQVAVIKRRLQILLPGVEIFLDVDDLEDIGNRKHTHTTATRIWMDWRPFTSCLR